MAKLTEKQAKLFTDRNWGVIATVREDGSPQATPVWIDYDGDSVLVNSAHGRTKVEEHPARPARDGDGSAGREPAERVRDGQRSAELVDEGAREHIDKMAKKYLGEDKYPYLGPGEQRVIIKIHPERVDGYGAGG